jgi:hypothetical protein
MHELLECGDTTGTVTAVEALERPTNDLNVLPRRRLDLDLFPRRSRARCLARHGQRGGRRGQRHRGESGNDYGPSARWRCAGGAPSVAASKSVWRRLVAPEAVRLMRLLDVLLSAEYRRG